MYVQVLDKGEAIEVWKNECSRQYMGARDRDEMKRRRMSKRPVGDIYIICGRELRREKLHWERALG